MNRLFLGLFVFSGVLSLGGQTAPWQPLPGHTQLPIWPGTVPDAQPVPGPEVATTLKDKLVAGRPWVEVDNVSRPTMTVYSPEGKNTGTARWLYFQAVALRDWRSTSRAPRFATG